MFCFWPVREHYCGWLKQLHWQTLAWAGWLFDRYYKVKLVSWLTDVWFVSEAASNMIPTRYHPFQTAHWASIHVEPPLKANVYTHPHINPQWIYLLGKISWHSDINVSVSERNYDNFTWFIWSGEEGLFYSDCYTVERVANGNLCGIAAEGSAAHFLRVYKVQSL